MPVLEDLIRLRTTSTPPVDIPGVLHTTYQPDGTRIIEALGGPAEPEEAHQLAVDLGITIPTGYIARILEARHDPAAWHRDNQGDDAVTRPAIRYKLAIEPARATLTAPIDDLLDLISATRTPTPTTTHPSHVGYVVALGDLQLGKVDQGGTPTAINHFLSSHQRSLDTYTQYRANNMCGDQVLICWVGDAIEGNQSQGGNLAAAGRIDLTITEQVRLYRKLLTRQLLDYAETGATLTVSIVPGNHDEAERRGKITRDPHDSWAIEAAMSAADALDNTPHHITWVFPQPGDLTTTLTFAGTRVGTTHGHQIPRGNVSQWLGSMALTRHPIGSVDLLITGHRHQLHTHQHGPTLHLQIPALESGSDHHTSSYGGGQPPGLITLTTHNHTWANLTHQ